MTQLALDLLGTLPNSPLPREQFQKIKDGLLHASDWIQVYISGKLDQTVDDHKLMDVLIIS